MTNFQAPVQEETTSDIYRERSYSWRKMSLGYGDFTQQSNGAPARYFYASNAWHAGAMRGLGPRLPAAHARRGRGRGGRLRGGRPRSPGAPPSPASSPSPGATCGAGTGRPAPSRPSPSTSGAGVVGRSWTRWTAGGPGPAGRPLPHRQPGAHRAPVALPGRGLDRPHRCRGAPPRAFVLATGPELWRVCGTVDQPDVPFAVSKCEADPTVPANWTAPIEVGDASRARHRAVRAADAPVRAQGGRHRVGPAGGRRHRHRPQPDPRPPRRAATRRTASAPPPGWGRCTSGPGTPCGASPGTAAERIGPERLVDNTSPVRGPVGAFCGFGAWYGLGAVYNATTQSSYLVQYGNWVPGGGDLPRRRGAPVRPRLGRLAVRPARASGSPPCT